MGLDKITFRAINNELRVVRRKQEGIKYEERCSTKFTKHKSEKPLN